MKKRGISHVEIILSFVLFVVAVGFALYIFNPGGGSRIAESSLDYSFIEITRNTSTSVETFSVIINKSEIVGNLISLNFSGVPGNTSVKTYNEEKLDSSRFGDLVVVKGLPSTMWSTIDVIYVSFGEEFGNDGVAYTEPNESYYNIGSSISQKIISEKNFLSLNSTYYSNYSWLKGRNQFNLPPRVDFRFSLVFEENDSIIAEKKIPAGLEFFSETRRVEVLRTNGEIVFADLIVKVW